MGKSNLGLMILLLSLCSSLTMTGQDILEDSVIIPAQLKISPERLAQLPVMERQYMLSELEQGARFEIFQAPPCMDGNFLVAIQLFYDVGDQNTKTQWAAGIEFSFLDNEISQWKNSLSVNMRDQKLLATAFHHTAVSCSKNYEIQLHRKIVDASVPQDNIYLRILLFRDQTEPFDPSGNLMLDVKASDEENMVVWNFSDPSVLGYDVEWVFVDAYANFSGNPQQAFVMYEPVRISTSSTYYTHNVLYPSGKLFYRVRAVGLGDGQGRLAGDWVYSREIIVQRPQEEMSYAIHTRFGTNGTFEKKVGYIDGNGRERQRIVSASDKNFSMAEENFYDYEGRPAVEVLPAPLATKTLRYQHKLNQFEAVDTQVQNEVHHARDRFHFDNGPLENSILSNVSGTSHYFSKQNQSGDSFLPDAEGYVYKQTIYSNDALAEGTVAMPGKVLRGDGEHVHRMYEGIASKAEVIRLLGADGLNQNLAKRLVTDVSGKSIVHYINERGKSVIETELAEASSSAEPVKINLLQGVAAGDRLSFVLLNTSARSRYSFSYSVNSDEVFDLEMSVQSPSGALMDLSFLPGNESTDPGIYRRQNVKASTLKNITFDLNFESIGSYTVSRRLTPVSLSVEKMLEEAKDREDVAELLADTYAKYKYDSLACGSCVDLTEAQQHFLFRELASQSVLAELENLRSLMVKDLQAVHGMTIPLSVADDSLRTHPLFDAYSFQRKNAASYIFDRELEQIGSWDVAVKAGLSQALNKDPFFNVDTLNGYGYRQAMQNKLDNIVIASLLTDQNTVEYKGAIDEVIDPDNSSFYVNVNGLPDADGIHPLYIDLLSWKNHMSREDFAAAIAEKRWNLYRNYYLLAKKEIIQTIPAYDQIPEKAHDSIAGNESVKSDRHARNTIAVMEWSFNKRFTTEDKQILAVNLAAYFASTPDNFLHVIVASDLKSSKDLETVQSVLNKYGCSLSDIAQDDKLNCPADDLSDPYLMQSQYMVQQDESVKRQASNRISTVSTAAVINEDQDASLQNKESVQTTEEQHASWSGASMKSVPPPPQEFNALVALYKRLGGNSWKNNTGWKHAYSGKLVSVAGWYGVITNEKGNVVALKLQNNNLRGSLPEEIGALTELQYLDLGSLSSDGNKITGSLPLAVGNLFRLTYLDLENNKLDGPFPVQLYRLTSLRSLNLNGNNFTGSLSADIGKLSALHHLALSGNELSGSLPAELGKLTALRHLDLSRNKFTQSIPASTGNLNQLVKVDLSYNGLSGDIPSTWSALKNVQYVRLNNNQLQRGIPVSIKSWKKVVQIDLSFNRLTGNVPPLNDLQDLQHLVLSNNQLNGNLPSDIPSLPSLKSINLSKNRIAGRIPSSLFESATVEYLDLSGNMLSGEIPVSIGTAPRLQRILLSENNLEGPIPSAAGNNSTLQELEIHHNQISGTLPENLSTMKSLRVLHAGNNNIEGKIPASIGKMTSLQTLILSFNKLTDSIPVELSNASNLQRLDLSNNSLAGSVPDELGNLKNLNELTLNNNNLTGHLPASLSHVSRVVVANNRLSGTIPAFVSGGNASKGDAVWLSYNKFTFADILPLQGQLDIESFLYHRQDSIDDNKTVPLFIDQPFELIAHVDRHVSPPCAYQWFRYVDGLHDVPLNEPSESAHTLRLKAVTVFDNGTKYYYTITNPAVPGLRLTSNIQTVMALPGNSLCLRYAPLNTFSLNERKEDHIRIWKERLEDEREILAQHEIRRILYKHVNERVASKHTPAETFTVQFTPAEHKHVVNHYDIAGNLIRSVEGDNVQSLDESQITAVLQGARIQTNDKKGRNYVYDSFNRMTAREEHDEATLYAYSKDGKVRLYQDATQRANNRYTYYRYDRHGREIEKGELRSRASFDVLQAKLDNPAFPDKSDEVLSDVTVTRYDHDESFNGRARGQVVRKEFVSEKDQEPSFTTYSYDVNGYLQNHVQHDPGFEDKVTAYRHDPLTGKLLFQFYQYGSPDEFSQRYEYCASGNLIQVSSSTDGFIWNKEAAYTYYDHGPLREIHIGEYNVSSTRYFYTIQGWPKGVNSQNAVSSDEQSEVYSYLLGYYKDDFKPIKGSYKENSPAAEESYNGTFSWSSVQVKETSVQSSEDTSLAISGRYVYDPQGRLLAAYKPGETPVHIINGMSQLGVHAGNDRAGTRTLGTRRFSVTDHLNESVVVVSDRISVSDKKMRSEMIVSGEAAKHSRVASYLKNRRELSGGAAGTGTTEKIEKR